MTDKAAADPEIPSGTFTDWQARRARRRARQENIDDALTVTGVQLMFLLTYFHVSYGLLVPLLPLHVRSTVGTGLLVCLAVIDGVLILRPQATLRVMNAVLHGVLLAVTRTVAYTLLAALYLVVQPFAYTVGRRSYLRHHPVSAAWCGGGTWKQPTSWQPKTLESAHANTGSSSTVARLLSRVGSGGNRFLLVLTLLILLVASLNFLVYSTKIAPFIYALF